MAGENRFTNWIVGAVIGTLLTIIAVFQIADYNVFNSEFHPLEYVTPLEIVNEDPILVGTELEVRLQRCNVSDEPISNVISIHFQGVVEDGQGGFIEIEGLRTLPKAFAVREFDPGCKDQIFTDELPDNVTVGFWKEVGATTVFNNGDSDVVRWESEVFEVVDAD